MNSTDVLATALSNGLMMAKILGAGLCTISLAGTGVGIGVVFGSYIFSVAMNPDMEKSLFPYTLLGFALTESIALFGIMMAFLLLFAF